MPAHEHGGAVLAGILSFDFVQDAAGARGAPPLVRVEITYAYIITLLLRKGKLFHYSFCEDNSFNLTHYHFKAERGCNVPRCPAVLVCGHRKKTVKSYGKY